MHFQTNTRMCVRTREESKMEVKDESQTTINTYH